MINSVFSIYSNNKCTVNHNIIVLHVYRVVLHVCRIGCTDQKDDGFYGN